MTAPTAAEIARAVQALERSIDPLSVYTTILAWDARTILAALAAAEADRASAVQAEREACRKIAVDYCISGHASQIAEAIRARGTVRPTDSERKEGDDASA